MLFLRPRFSLPRLGLGCSWVVRSKYRYSSSSSHYSILGVSSDATKEEIKSAFLALSKKYHPDKNPESDTKAANEQFSRINEAYSVLSDTAKRSLYDRKWYGQYTHHSHYHSGVKRDEKFDFYKYDPKVKAYTYARAYNYYDVNDDAWKSAGLDSTSPELKERNLNFLKWLLVICFCGAALQSVRIHYTHKQYNKQSMERTRKLQATYDSVIENSKHSTVQQQLEQLRRNVQMDDDKYSGSKAKAHNTGDQKS